MIWQCIEKRPEPGATRAYIDFLLELLHQDLRLWTMLWVREVELTINGVFSPCCYLLCAPICSSRLHECQTCLPIDPLLVLIMYMCSS